MRVLSFAFVVSLSALSSALAAPPETETDRASWLLTYVMSYDNNLEQCGPVILDGLRRGTEGTDVVVTVLADFTDTDGLRRYILRDGQAWVAVLDTEDSASEEVLEEYLNWAHAEFPADAYGTVFLDHGGNLDDMCLDENPGEGNDQWLSARAVGPVLRRYRERAEDVRLVFLQQCGRGSLDNLYNFHQTADTVMASQTTVGAPNTYYAATVQWLGEHPDATGVELADRIMLDDQHYTTYVSVDGEALTELPGQLDVVVEALLDAGDLSPVETLRPCFGGQTRNSETNYDALGYLSALADGSGDDAAIGAVVGFERWVTDTLMVGHRKHPRQARRIRNWTGLALYVPVSPAVRGRYADYPLYEDSRLDDLWARLFPSRR